MTMKHDSEKKNNKSLEAKPDPKKYMIGNNAVRLLLGLPGLGEQDKAAIWRLEDFKGSADDLRHAARLFDDAGEPANAESLRTLLREDS
jgi:hypothetical protein